MDNKALDTKALDTKAFVLEFHKAVLTSRSDVLILTHAMPDGDAVGSALAIQVLLRLLKVKSKIIWDKVNPDAWKNWPVYQEATTGAATDVETYPVVITVDCSNPERLGDAQHFITSAKTIINIDHHGDNSQFGTLNWVHEASSVGELIDAFIPFFDVTITMPLAEALIVSIVTDTGRFKYGNTSSHVFLIMHRLVSLVGQTRYHKLVTDLYAEESLLKWQLISEAVQNLTMVGDGIAFSYITSDCGEEDGLVDPVLSIRGVRAAVLARQAGDQLRLSFRAKDPAINVRTLAATFGGGGHVQASGATLPLTDFPSQIDEIKTATEAYFRG